jgi:selenocysteine lyase/cysteine desulfurase
MNRLTAEFPVTKSLIHLNHAAVAPWPQRTVHAINRFADENLQRGSWQYLQWIEREAALRHKIAQLINAATADAIALVKNTSEGLSFVAAGLDWQRGDNVVGIQQEFPSNRFVWQSLKDQGVEFRSLDLQSHRDDPESALLALCDERTRLISVSAVQYSDGLRLNLPFVGEFCHENQVLFCIDAIQQVGAIPLDVQSIQADFVIADGHKWMLSPEGLGFFYIKPELLNRLRPSQFGWHMADNMADYTATDFIPAITARRFECGSPNMLGIHALDASLGLLLETGMETIWQSIQTKIAVLQSGLEAIPRIEILSDFSASRRSGILTFRHQRISNAALHAELQAKQVFCATRGGGVRFSPHFYTPETQLESVLEIIEAIA